MSVLASVVGLSGCAIIDYGVWQYNQPAAFLAAGLELLFIAWRLS